MKVQNIVKQSAVMVLFQNLHLMIAWFMRQVPAINYPSQETMMGKLRLIMMLWL